MTVNKVVIIGSQGFVGNHLEKHLKSIGYDVWGCDIIPSVNSKYFYINTKNTCFDEVFMSGFDVCINCSGAANVPESLNNPMNDFNLNTINVFKILDSIRRRSPNCKFINLSSAAVYGNPEALPIKEISKRSPVSPYGWHKLQAEDICQEYYENYDIKTISLRIFSAYGEGIRKQLLWDVYKKSRESSYLDFWGTGEESRDFIYILDLLQAIHLVIENAEFNGSQINIANGEEICIKDAISLMLNELNWKGEFNFTGEGRKGDPSRWVADVSQLLDLGYEKQISFENGVRNYCKWLK